MMGDIISQPPIPKRVVGEDTKTKRFFAGSKKSQIRLKQLYFDPIEELVNQYRLLSAEVDRQEKIRNREIIELTTTGKERAYRAEIHHALFDKMTKIAGELLRYGYGRVPELNVTENRAPASLVVNLTKKGDQYVVNEPEPVTDDEDYEEESYE